MELIGRIAPRSPPLLLSSEKLSTANRRPFGGEMPSTDGGPIIPVFGSKNLRKGSLLPPRHHRAGDRTLRLDVPDRDFPCVSHREIFPLYKLRWRSARCSLRRFPNPQSSGRGLEASTA